MPDRKRTIGSPEDDPNPALAKGHRYLLAIGIDQYEHYPRLYNAVRDARDFVALMQEKYGFSGEQATVVTLFDEEATGDIIQAQLEKLADQVTENDSCLLYFSGHGTYHKTLDEGYWIPVDAKKGERRGYLQNAVVQKILTAIKSHHTFLIADSCFSGSMFVGTPVRDASDSLEREPSRWGLTSGRNEVVADGKPGENSPFAKELLHLLRNSEHPLGVASLCAKMMEIVTANAQQTPRGEPLSIRGHRGGQYIFRPTDTAAMQADADWARAERLHTEAAYDHFVEQHPRDARAALAEQRMAELADDRKWQAAHAKGGLIDYRNYQRAYPNGRHAAEAQEHIKALREMETEAVPTPVTAPKPAVSPVSVPAAPSVPAGFVFVKGGTFQMGSENGEDYEKPVHTVSVSDFYMAKYALSVAEFKTFVEASGYKTDAEKGNGSYIWDGETWKEQKGVHWRHDVTGKPRPESEDKRPVIHVSWNDATEYTKWLTQQRKDGKQYRLPTEAEWEYAARGGQLGLKDDFEYAGSNNIDEVAWYAENSGFQTRPVGLKKPNQLGLYDISGNVLEWCADWYGDYPAAARANPIGPEKGTYRVYRGGSWLGNAQDCRVATRLLNTPTRRDDQTGFRLVLSALPV